MFGVLYRIFLAFWFLLTPSGRPLFGAGVNVLLLWFVRHRFITLMPSNFAPYGVVHECVLWCGPVAAHWTLWSLSSL